MAGTRRPSPQTAAVLIELSALSTGWAHGYELCRTLGLKPGTVYPILMRLADRGLVETTWEPAGVHGRPPRHLYRLSAAGARFLAGHRVKGAEATEGGAKASTAPPRPALGAAGS